MMSPRERTGASRRRVLAAGLVALLVHAPVAVLLGPARASRAPRVDVGAQRATLRAELRVERAALLREAEAEVSSPRAKLGEVLIGLGWLDGAEEGLDATPPLVPAPHERALALASYRAMLAEVRGAVARGEAVERAIVDAVGRDGRAGRYKRMYPRLVDALVHGGGNCVALSTLAASLAHDAGSAERSGFRVYSNHVAPDVGGFRFGMAKHCRGAGVRVASRELLAAYAQARFTGSREPFALPASEEPCEDPGDLYGELQLVGDDARPGAVSPGSPVSPADAAAGAGSPAATAPRSPDEPGCRRRTVLEEYEDDVEVLAADGRTLGAVGIPRAASLDLAGHASSASCFDRRAAAMSADSDPQALVLALGDAAMAAEESARVFAAAGELDVARAYEHRLAQHRARAAAPLEQVIARLNDPAADVGATLAGAGRLVALGEGGRTAMLLASERHRGFWELANLMTRPSSQLGAIDRWSRKPVDVRLDVIDALPCASATFLAQLDGVAHPAARALHAACEVRARVDGEPCALAGALAHARGGASPGQRDEGDLAEAVLVRHLAPRCRGPVFGAEARRWAATKPEPIARALASRLAAE